MRTQPYGFSTKRYDAQIGLIHYEFRDYIPALARWTTRDPLGEAGGLNLYAFVGNNPVNWVDPWGLSAVIITLERDTETVNSTTGKLSVTSQIGGYMLELPWKGNRNNISRIPAGTYLGKIKKAQNSQFPYDVIEVLHVDGRSNILIHKGNKPKHTKGCILPGETRTTDFVGSSGSMFNKIMDIIKQTQAVDRMLGESTDIIIHIIDPPAVMTIELLPVDPMYLAL